MDTVQKEKLFLDEITERMEVVDMTGEKVGRIKYIQPPVSSIAPDLDEFPYDLNTTGIHQEMAYRLLNNGFVCVDAGWFAKDRLVMPGQIAAVHDGKAYLNTKLENLIAV